MSGTQSQLKPCQLLVIRVVMVVIVAAYSSVPCLPTSAPLLASLLSESQLLASRLVPPLTLRCVTLDKLLYFPGLDFLICKRRILPYRDTENNSNAKCSEQCPACSECPAMCSHHYLKAQPPQLGEALRPPSAFLSLQLPPQTPPPATIQTQRPGPEGAGDLDPRA